ncbi:hypothetical protein GEMRC1_010295 [Eukaryota sp. GEM-RC1]
MQTSLKSVFIQQLKQRYRPQPIILLDEAFMLSAQAHFEFAKAPSETYKLLKTAVCESWRVPHPISFAITDTSFIPSAFFKDFLIFDARILSSTPIFFSPPFSDSSTSLAYLLSVDVLTQVEENLSNKNSLPDTDSLSPQPSSSLLPLPSTMSLLISEATALLLTLLMTWCEKLKGKPGAKSKFPTDYVFGFSCVPVIDRFKTNEAHSKNVSQPLLDLSLTFTPSVYGLSAFKSIILLMTVSQNLIKPNILILGDSRAGKSLVLKGISSLPGCTLINSKTKPKELALLARQSSFLLIDDLDSLSSAIKITVTQLLIQQETGIVMTMKPSTNVSSVAGMVDFVFELTSSVISEKDSFKIAKHLTNPLRASSSRGSHESPRFTPINSPYLSRSSTPVVEHSEYNNEELELFPDEFVNKSVCLKIGSIINFDCDCDFDPDAISKINSDLDKLAEVLSTLGCICTSSIGKFRLKKIIMALSLAYTKFLNFPERRQCSVTVTSVSIIFKLIRSALYHTDPNETPTTTMPLTSKLMKGPKSLGKGKLIKLVNERLKRLAQLSNGLIKPADVETVVRQIGPSFDVKEVVALMSEAGLLLKKNVSGKQMYKITEI